MFDVSSYAYLVLATQGGRGKGNGSGNIADKGGFRYLNHIGFGVVVPVLQFRIDKFLVGIGFQEIVMLLVRNCLEIIILLVPLHAPCVLSPAWFGVIR